MLKKFDNFFENIIVEGRQSDDKKKFKVDLNKVKEHIDSIGNKHQHYTHDKGYFTALIDDLSSEKIYTPKTFIEDIKSAMNSKGKKQIADGYSKLLYSFLNDRVDSPFKNYKEEEEKKEDTTETSDETEPAYDSILPDSSDSETQEAK